MLFFLSYFILYTVHFSTLRFVVSAFVMPQQKKFTYLFVLFSFAVLIPNESVACMCTQVCVCIYVNMQTYSYC